MKYLILILSFLLSFSTLAALSDADKAAVVQENVFVNGGAEQGKAGWGVDTGGTLSVDTGTKLSGKASIKFISANATHKLVTNAYAVKHGPNCNANFWYKTTSATWTAYVMEGSNTVATLALPSATNFTQADLSFVCTDATTTYHLHIVDSAGAGTIYIDDAYMGKNLNIGSVNLQDKQYDLTTACGGSTCLTGDPGFAIKNATAIPYKDRDGNWHLKYSITQSETGNNDHYVHINGITFSGISEGGRGEEISCHDMDGNYATTFSQAIGSQDHTRCIFSGSVSNASIWGDSRITAKPSWATDYASEQVVKAESSASLWSGIFESNCEWIRTTTSWGDFPVDSSCTLTSDYSKNISIVKESSGLPGITITPSSVGEYEVCAMINWRTESSGQSALRLYDVVAARAYYGLSNYNISTNAPIGGTICFIANFDSLTARTIKIQGYPTGAGVTVMAYPGGSAVTWTVKKITQQSPMPQIINSVTTLRPGQMRLEMVSTSNCTSSPCTIATQSSNWVSSITRNGIGDYTVNFNAGVWSTAPVCFYSGSASNGWQVYVSSVGNPSTSSTRVGIFGAQNGTEYSQPVYAYNWGLHMDGYIQVLCYGIIF